MTFLCLKIQKIWFCFSLVPCRNIVNRVTSFHSDTKNCTLYLPQRWLQVFSHAVLIYSIGDFWPSSYCTYVMQQFLILSIHIFRPSLRRISSVFLCITIPIGVQLGLRLNFGLAGKQSQPLPMGTCPCTAICDGWFPVTLHLKHKVSNKINLPFESTLL